MSKDKLVTIRVTTEEMERLKHLSAAKTLSDSILASAFSVKGTQQNKRDTQHCWVVEKDRRDLGIKIVSKLTPEIILYPEDTEYEKFSKMEIGVKPTTRSF